MNHSIILNNLSIGIVFQYVFEFHFFIIYKGNTNIGNNGLKSICKGIKSNPGTLEQIKMNLGYSLIVNNGFFIVV